MDYIKGLDGLRGFLVLSVVLFHALTIFYPKYLDYFQGGFLAVESFFVISGFLITKILIRLNLYHENPYYVFFIYIKRRFLRIFPALLFMVLPIFILTYTLGINSNVEEESIFSLTFVYNFYLNFRDMPYFQKFEEINLFTHIWSLSIEFQLYLATGLIFLIFSLTKLISRKLLFAAFILLVSISLFINYYYFNILNINPDKIYFATESRSFGFFMGSILALFEKEITGRLNEISGYLIGTLSSLSLLVSFITMSVYTDWFYPFGFLMADILTLLLIVSFLNSRYIRESFGILDWFGKRSYSVYLWHYPIFVITNLIYGSTLFNIFLILLIIMLISDLTYRLVEKPFRDLEFNIQLVPLSISLVLLLTTGFLLTNITKEDSYAYAKENSKKYNKVDDNMKNQENDDNKQTASYEKNRETDESYRVIMIGDSVLLGAANYIKKLIPTAKIDAKVGRQVSDIINIIDIYKNEMNDVDIVVIHIGNNGYARREIFEDIVSKIGKDKKIYFLTVNASVPWKDKVNDNIRYLKKYSNVKVIDWDKVQSPELFTKDKVHLSNKGIVKYSKLIASSLGLTLAKGMKGSSTLQSDKGDITKSTKPEYIIKDDYSSEEILKAINDSQQ